MSNKNLKHARSTSHFHSLLWAISIALLSACSSVPAPAGQNAASNSNNASGNQTATLRFSEGVCQIASTCSHVTATQADIDACPATLDAHLTSPAAQTRVAEFENLSQQKQDCALDCMAGLICTRFSGSILFISDSDALEPFAQCEPVCDARNFGSSTAQLNAGQFIEETCNLAAACGHVSPTQADRAACPATLAAELSSTASQAQLTEFAAFSRAKQDCTLNCLGGMICPRFGSTILAISDSDALEPMQECAEICDNNP